MNRMKYKRYFFYLFLLVIILVFIIYFFNSKQKISFPEKNYSKEIILNMLAPGVYNNLSITLTGDTIIHSQEQLIINNSKIDLNNHSLIFREGSKGEIRNSIILNASEEYWDGYVSRHPEEMENIMRNENKWGVKPSAGLGVETNSFILDKSIVKNSYGHGIYLYYAKNPKITNSFFINNSWCALRSEGSTEIYFINNTLKANAWQNPSKVGFAQIDINSGEDSVFSFNKVFSKTVTEGAVTFYNQKNLTIFNNEFDDVILLDKCSNCVIKNNFAKELNLFGCEKITNENNKINKISESEKSGPEAWS